MFDGGLVLGGRRNDRRRADQAALTDFVAVVQKSPRCLAHAVADTGARGNVDERLCRALVLGDDAQRLFDRVDHLDSTYYDAAERVSALRPKPAAGGGIAGDRREGSGVE